MAKKDAIIVTNMEPDQGVSTRSGQQNNSGELLSRR